MDPRRKRSTLLRPAQGAVGLCGRDRENILSFQSQKLFYYFVFGRLWKECGVQEVIQSLLEAHRYDFDVERSFFPTVLHWLLPAAAAGERWREDYLIPRSEALELHHLYRALAFLGQEIGSKGQKTLGTPRCRKDLKEQLRSRDRSLVGNKGYHRYLKLEGSGHFVIDEKQVKAEKRFR